MFSFVRSGYTPTTPWTIKVTKYLKANAALLRFSVLTACFEVNAHRLKKLTMGNAVSRRSPSQAFTYSPVAMAPFSDADRVIINNVICHFNSKI